MSGLLPRCRLNVFPIDTVDLIMESGNGFLIYIHKLAVPSVFLRWVLLSITLLFCLSMARHANAQDMIVSLHAIMMGVIIVFRILLLLMILVLK